MGPALELISPGGVRAGPGFTKIRINNAVGDQKMKLLQAFHFT